MTPEEYAKLAADLYGEFRKVRINGDPLDGTMFFSKEHAFELTKTVLQEIACREGLSVNA